MNRMESTSAAHLVKMTQPEEFDLVTLGDGTGSSGTAWRFAGEDIYLMFIKDALLGRVWHHSQNVPQRAPFYA